MKDLIPISYLSEACFLSLNTDDKKYRMCLKMAQDNLSDILSKDFYDQIESQFPSSLSADNSALYEGYLKEYLAWNTYFNYLKFANVDATPTGIRAFSDDNSTLASDIQMYSLEKHVRAEYEKHKFRMIVYLDISKTNDSSKFPYWTLTCRQEMSFGITAISGTPSTSFNIEKSIKTNE
jgi:hypothetical protein